MNPLLIAVACGYTQIIVPIKLDKTYRAEGLFVCGSESSHKVQVTVPPVIGQFTAQNRDIIIDLFDFDGRPESKGAWFWRETTQKDPVYSVTLPAVLPTILTTSSGVTGVQQAEVQYVAIKDPMGPLDLTYTCDGQQQNLVPSTYAAGNGVGACVVITGSQIVVDIKVPASTVTRLVGCKNELFESSYPTSQKWTFEAENCDLQIRQTDANGSVKNATLVYRTRERTNLMPRPIPGRWPFDSVANAEDNAGQYSWGAKGQFSWRRK